MEQPAQLPVLPETLEGKIGLKFNTGYTLINLCEKTFTGFHADNHEPIALRLYYGKEIILTLYALDKVRQETGSTPANRLPVRKFKQQLHTLHELLPWVAEFNFTLEAGNFPLDEMEVVNK